MHLKVAAKRSSLYCGEDVPDSGYLMCTRFTDLKSLGTRADAIMLGAVLVTIVDSAKSYLVSEGRNA